VTTFSKELFCVDDIDIASVEANTVDSSCLTSDKNGRHSNLMRVAKGQPKEHAMQRTERANNKMYLINFLRPMISKIVICTARLTTIYQLQSTNMSRYCR